MQLTMLWESGYAAGRPGKAVLQRHITYIDNLAFMTTLAIDSGEWLSPLQGETENFSHKLLTSLRVLVEYT